MEEAGTSPARLSRRRLDRPALGVPVSPRCRGAHSTGRLSALGRAHIARARAAIARWRATTDRSHAARTVCRRAVRRAWVILSMQVSQRRCTRSRASLLLTSSARIRRTRWTVLSLVRSFRYAGHTEVEDGRGAMVQLASAELMADRQLTGVSRLEALPNRSAWAWNDVLALRLSRAGTKLAVFKCVQQRLLAVRPPVHACGCPRGRRCAGPREQHW